MELLLKIFVKDYKNTQDTKVRQRYGVFSSIVGIIANLILFVFKFIAGIITASIAITADAFNNLSDAGSSIITFIGFKLSSKRPDPSHPFGHGRIEYLTGLAVSVLVIIMGFELFKTSIEKIISPALVEANAISIVILIAAIVAKLLMALMNFNLSKKINSSAMKATAIDSLSDTISTLVVLVGIVLSSTFGLMIDGWLGLVVAGLILFAGIKSTRETITPLLGVAPEKELVDEIEKIVMGHEEIHGIHDLVVHDYGPGRLMITLHAEVPADGDILVLHDVIDNAESELKEQLNCHATIHLDPVDVNDEKTNELKQKVIEIVKNIGEEITIHDFRIVSGPTHTNLVFDVCVPFNYRVNDREIEKTIKEEIKKIDSTYFAYPVVEHSYVGQEIKK